MKIPMEDKINFLKKRQDAMPILGFWEEISKYKLINSILLRYNTDIIREWLISDIVINDDKVLLKWFKRDMPLSDEELKDDYGR